MQYKETNVTSKKGINYIRSVVEASSCLFHKIDQENDLGIDCIIEFTKDEKPIHKSIACQIKSGESFFDHKNNQCIIPVYSHYEYWSKYPLPVYGFVYVPPLDNAYFVNIKSYLENHNQCKTIKFDCTRSNVIDLKSFKEIFVPIILGDIPTINFEEAVTFFESAKQQESYLGAKVLFRRYKNNQVTWDKLINYLINTEIESFNFNVIYFVSHIPWHSDIFHFGEKQDEEVRNYAKEKIKNLNKEVVLKLLRFIDLEEGIVRGSIGQSIESILSNIIKIEKHLSEIINDRNVELETKEKACEILAYYQGIKSIKTLSKLIPESKSTAQIIAFLKKYKSYNFYQ